MPLTTQQRRDIINSTKPWLKSTGATSELGKLVTSTNALKTGLYSKNPLLRLIAKQERMDFLLEEFENRAIEIIKAKRSNKSTRTTEGVLNNGKG